MSAIVLLMRHAAHDELNQILSGRSEVALNRAGRESARQLARWLAGAPLTAIHSSPRRRARETAEIVARPHRLKVEIVDALDEIDFGAWAGCSFEALATDPLWQHWNESRGSAKAPGGEDMSGAIARALAHIEAIDRGQRMVLCVSHCDIIRGIVAHYRQWPIDEMLAIDIAPASLTLLDPAERRLLAVNQRTAWPLQIPENG